ncbi:MAG: hypothetical protein [Bacteriophage sp.]|nr:MAG: hypothetical protein [Bacteriophage sp.]
MTKEKFVSLVNQYIEDGFYSLEMEIEGGYIVGFNAFNVFPEDNRVSFINAVRYRKEDTVGESKRSFYLCHTEYDKIKSVYI